MEDIAGPYKVSAISAKNEKPAWTHAFKELKEDLVVFNDNIENKNDLMIMDAFSRKIKSKDLRTSSPKEFSMDLELPARVTVAQLDDFFHVASREMGVEINYHSFHVNEGMTHLVKLFITLK